MVFVDNYNLAKKLWPKYTEKAGKRIQELQIVLGGAGRSEEPYEWIVFDSFVAMSAVQDLHSLDFK